MKMTEEAEKLLKRYLLSIAGRLPLKSRNDILQELKSNLFDMIEEYYPDKETRVDETMLTKVLQEFGNPESISSEFLKNDYIIGPLLMPFFRLAVSVAFTTAAVVLVISTVLSALNGKISGITDIIISLLQAVPSIFGILVFIFFMIQKTAPKLPGTSSLPHFNPLDLKDQEKEKPVSLAEQIINIFFTSFIIIILVFFRDLLQIRISAGTACTVYQILKPGFISIIPLLVIRGSLDILLAVRLIIARTRNYRIRVVEILLSGFDAAIIILFLQNGPDYFFSFDSLAEIRIGTDPLSLIPILRGLFYGILALILAFTVFDIIKKIFRIVRKPQLNDDII